MLLLLAWGVYSGQLMGKTITLLLSLEIREDQELHRKAIAEFEEQMGNFYNKEYGRKYI